MAQLIRDLNKEKDLKIQIDDKIIALLQERIYHDFALLKIK